MSSAVPDEYHRVIQCQPAPKPRQECMRLRYQRTGTGSTKDRRGETTMTEADPNQENNFRVGVFEQLFNIVLLKSSARQCCEIKGGMRSFAIITAPQVEIIIVFLHVYSQLFLYAF